ncbi:class I SAM-dependent methyltransferase [Pseudorhodoplanes sinuspersici]|nr:class I SAM-dependent methyltransferase [Pseudorhodoplanes sinuspersici]
MGDKMVGRAFAVNRLLQQFENASYLEIGVAKGKTFHEISAYRKTAVDPKFQFDVTEARRANPHSSYHQVASDDFFGSIADHRQLFDVINIDGLHTAEQTLRDLLNAMSHLAPKGIIIIDDTRPSSHLASIADFSVRQQVASYLKSNDHAWMGDVFRVVYFLESMCQQFSFRTIQENHGQTVVWRKRRPKVRSRTLSYIGGRTFEDLVTELDVLRLAPFEEILSELSDRR